VQDLSTQETELAVAKHQDFVCRLQVNLFQDFEGCGQRLGEDCFFVCYTIGNRMQVGNRNRYIFGEAAIGVLNAHHSAFGTVTLETPGAVYTATAGKIDLADDTFPDERHRALVDLTDKFMAGHTLEPHIALENLDIRRTDASQVDADQCHVIVRLWGGIGDIKT
jgi:hypothetical protein